MIFEKMLVLLCTVNAILMHCVICLNGWMDIELKFSQFCFPATANATQNKVLPSYSFFS